MNWILYQKEAAVTDMEDETAKEIVSELGGKVEKSFFGLPRRERTSKLFEILTELGDRKGYKVYSHSLSEDFCAKHNHKYANREWLYDLLWYTEEEGYFPTDFPLVVESEWSKKRKADPEDRYSGIKYDFQKLLLPNTGLRLMIFKTTGKTAELENLSRYFLKAINTYGPSKHADFLFVGFCNRRKSFYYAHLKKRCDGR